MAYKVFANGNPLQASELNENLMQQAVAVFTDSSARDAAITSPVNGQFAYLTGSSLLVKYDGSAWVGALEPAGTTVTEQATSRTITAADANTYIYATAAITITVDDELEVGETINFIQDSSGAITFAGGVGVTVNSKNSFLSTNGENTGASLTKKSSNTYYLVGDLV